jgi:hypothetical protein
MMLPDIIVSWPRNCDYPLWRQFIRDSRDGFNEVFVVFTETYHGEDYRDFVRTAMAEDRVQFINMPQYNPSIDDWRNVAIHEALKRPSTAEWVWFTEQDFYITDPQQFWTEIGEGALSCNAIGVLQGERLHPCCLFIRKDELAKTGQNFGIVPGVLDHFGLIQKDLEALKKPVGLIGPESWKHYNGLSHNFRLLSDGDVPNYQTEEFYDWLKQSLAVSVPLDERFVKLGENAVKTA